MLKLNFPEVYYVPTKFLCMNIILHVSDCMRAESRRRQFNSSVTRHAPKCHDCRASHRHRADDEFASEIVKLQKSFVAEAVISTNTA